MKQFFIVGCPRSGTTMLQQALNRHPQVAVPPETAFFSLLGYSRAVQREHLQRIREDLQIDLPTPAGRLAGALEAQALYEEIGRRYVAGIDKPGATHFGDKTNEHLNRLGRIQRVLPDSRVILLYRDGRDVALSMRRLPWTSRDLYVNFWVWLYCCRLQRQAERSCQLPLLPVRYEDLVKDPETVLSRALAFLELPYDAAVVTGGGSGSGIPPWEIDWKGQAAGRIRTDRTGVWRAKLSAAEVGILERWGGRALRDLGYELTTDGKAALPWFFRLRVACKAAIWLARRPRYGQAKAFWVQQHGVPFASEGAPQEG